MILIILVWMSIQDVKKLEITTLSQIILLLACLLNITTIKYFIVLLIIFWIINHLFKEKIGGADLKVFLMLSLVYGEAILYIIMISTIVAIPICIIYQKIPFIPFITIGVICLNLAI